MSTLYYAFLRANEYQNYTDSRSPWVPLGIEAQVSTFPAVDIAAHLRDIPLDRWRGRFDLRYMGWKAVTAALRHEDTEPDMIYELLYLPTDVVADMTVAQAGLMANELSRATCGIIEWTQSHDRVAGVLPFRPRSEKSAGIYYRSGARFYAMLEAMVAANDKAAPDIIGNLASPQKHEEPLVEAPARPTGAMRELAIPHEPTELQQHRARFTGSRLDPQATLLFLRRLRRIRAGTTPRPA